MLERIISSNDMSIRSEIIKLEYTKVDKEQIAHLLRKKTFGLFLEY